MVKIHMYSKYYFELFNIPPFFNWCKVLYIFLKFKIIPCSNISWFSSRWTKYKKPLVLIIQFKCKICNKYTLYLTRNIYAVGAYRQPLKIKVFCSTRVYFSPDNNSFLCSSIKKKKNKHSLLLSKMLQYLQLHYITWMGFL